jgi:hypothetical protein
MQISKMTPAQAVSAWGKKRVANKNKWITVQFELDTGYTLVIKSFNTWVQVARLYPEGSASFKLQDSNTCDQPVGKANAWLLDFCAYKGE